MSTYAEKLVRANARGVDSFTYKTVAGMTNTYARIGDTGRFALVDQPLVGGKKKRRTKKKTPKRKAKKKTPKRKAKKKTPKRKRR